MRQRRIESRGEDADHRNAHVQPVSKSNLGCALRRDQRWSKQYGDAAHAERAAGEDIEHGQMAFYRHRRALTWKITRVSDSVNARHDQYTHTSDRARDIQLGKFLVQRGWRPVRDIGLEADRKNCPRLMRSETWRYEGEEVPANARNRRRNRELSNIGTSGGTNAVQGRAKKEAQ
ncbi:hypothetical protein BKA93DRAFT_754534 [Sparassis latifolia]